MHAHAILWDLDNTLFDRDAAFERWLDALPIAMTPPQRTHLLGLDDRGQGDRNTLFGWMAKAWPMLGDLDAIWRAMRSALPGYARPDPAMRRLIERTPCCVLTNGSGPLQRAKAQAIGVPLPATRILVSGELGVAKPDARAFEAALTVLGTRTAVMVGDDPIADIMGAQRVGLATIWLRRGRCWPTHLEPPTHIIDTLDALL